MERHVGVGLNDTFDDYVHIDFQYFHFSLEKNHAFLHHNFWPKSSYKMTIGFVFAVRYFLWPK